MVELILPPKVGVTIGVATSIPEHDERGVHRRAEGHQQEREHNHERDRHHDRQLRPRVEGVLADPRLSLAVLAGAGLIALASGRVPPVVVIVGSALLGTLLA